MKLRSYKDSLFQVMTEFPAGVNTMLLLYFFFLLLPSCSFSYSLLQLPLPVCQVAHPTHLLCNKSSSPPLAGGQKGHSERHLLGQDPLLKPLPPMCLWRQEECELHCMSSVHLKLSSSNPRLWIYLPLMFSYSVYLPLMFILSSLQDFQEYHSLGTYLETNL